MHKLIALAGISLLSMSLSAHASFTTVFDSDFDNFSFETSQGVYAELAGGLFYDSQGYRDRGFDSMIYALDHTTVNGLIELTLTNLPTHNKLSLSGLLAVINSWDGGLQDALSVYVDGVLQFSTYFVEPDGMGTNLTPEGRPLLYTLPGDKSTWGDRAYDFTGFAPLTNINHTASTATISFLAHGSNWQGKHDESFGFGALRVTTSTNEVDLNELTAPFNLTENGQASLDVESPATVGVFGLGLALLSIARKPKRKHRDNNDLNMRQ